MVSIAQRIGFFAAAYLVVAAAHAPLWTLFARIAG